MRSVLSGVSRRDGFSLENPQYPLTAGRILDMFTGGPTAAGVMMNEREAPTLSACYRAVTLLAGLMSYIPLKSYKPDGAGRAREDITDSIGVMTEPYPDMTAYEWTNVMAWNYFLWGNCYALKVRNQLGNKVMRMLPLPASDISPRREKPTAENPSGKFFESQSMQFRDYTPFEILHIPGPGYDGVKGLSPIGLARQALAIGKAAETYGANLFGKGTLQGHALTTDEELEDDDAERLKRRWQEKVAGIAHAHELLVLDNGAHLEKLQLTPEDAQFLQTREFSVFDVARIYGIPPHLLMAKDATSNWGTGVEVHALQMLTFTLQPHLTSWEQKLTAHGRPQSIGAAGSGPGWLPAGGWHEFLTDALLRIDAKTRAESYAKGIQYGYFTRAEARDKENLPPIPGLEKPLVPVNMRNENDLADLKDKAQVIKALADAGCDINEVLKMLGMPPLKTDVQAAPAADPNAAPDTPPDAVPPGGGGGTDGSPPEQQ